MKTIFKILLISRMNSKLVLIVLINMAMTNNMVSQTEKAKTGKLNGGFGHFTFSGEQLNLDKLNTSLAANGYGHLNPLVASYGGGGNFCFNNVLVGGGGAWLSGERTHNATNAVDFQGGYGFFSFGYVVHASKRSLFYPRLGVGGGGYDITVSKKNINGDFSQQLNTPGDMTTINSGGWMSNIELCYQFFFNKTQKAGYFIGFKAAYKYSPYNWGISVNNTSLNNAPKINMNGFTASIIFGGGGLMTQ